QDHIYIRWRNNARFFLVSHTETMGEIQGFTWSKMFLHCWPKCNLPCIRKKELKDSAFFTSFFQFEKCFARNPAISYSFVPSFGAFTLTYNHVESIVLQVKCLTWTLNSVT